MDLASDGGFASPGVERDFADRLARKKTPHHGNLRLGQIEGQLQSRADGVIPGDFTRDDQDVAHAAPSFHGAEMQMEVPPARMRAAAQDFALAVWLEGKPRKRLGQGNLVLLLDGDAAGRASRVERIERTRGRVRCHDSTTGRKKQRQAAGRLPDDHQVHETRPPSIHL